MGCLGLDGSGKVMGVCSKMLGEFSEPWKSARGKEGGREGNKGPKLV